MSELVHACDMKLCSSLHGIMRVTSMTQDDGHIFARLNKSNRSSCSASSSKKCMLSLALRNLRKISNRPECGWVRDGTPQKQRLKRLRCGGSGMDFKSWRRCFLRTETRIRFEGLHRTSVAMRHHSIGLQPAYASFIGIHHRHGFARCTRDDPSSFTGFVGAIHRHFDRMTLRSLSTVDGAGSSDAHWHI